MHGTLAAVQRHSHAAVQAAEAEAAAYQVQVQQAQASHTKAAGAHMRSGPQPPTVGSQPVTHHAGRDDPLAAMASYITQRMEYPDAQLHGYVTPTSQCNAAVQPVMQAAVQSAAVQADLQPDGAGGLQPCMQGAPAEVAACLEVGLGTVELRRAVNQK